jgi:putative DNA primase/helicase
LTSNEICQFEDSSSVIITRLCGLFFQNSFEGREDPRLLQALKAELPGIAEWAREGYRRFVRNRMTFTVNPYAAEFLRNMRDETSPISAFVGECCEVVPGGRVSKDDLYGAYAEFALFNLETPLSKNRFSRELFSIAHGVKRSNCKEFYDNITLKA